MARWHVRPRCAPLGRQSPSGSPSTAIPSAQSRPTCPSSILRSWTRAAPPHRQCGWFAGRQRDDLRAQGHHARGGPVGPIMPRPAVLSLVVLTMFLRPAHAQRANRAVYIDNQGVIRWKDDKREVALFGANYVLPTASDYRAAGYLHADRKAMIDEDMAQFARMG